MSRCGCTWCDSTGHKDFVRGGVGEDDFADEFRPPPRRKSRKKCKKSKTGEPCAFTQTKTLSSYLRWSDMLQDYVRREQTVKICERCGKYNWNGYFSNYGF